MTIRTQSLLAAVLIGSLSSCESASPPLAQTPAPQTTKIADQNGLTLSGELICGKAFTSIAAIQGEQAISSMIDQTVETEAVVTGNFVSGLDGFFIQAPDAEQDQSVNTAEGIFVAQTNRIEGLVRGTRVRIRAVVQELGERAPSLTTLIPATDGIVLCASGVALPSAIEINQAPSSWSQFEGMRIRINHTMTLLGNDELVRFGALTVGFNGRQYSPTEILSPGPEARALEEKNKLERITLDDNRIDEQPKNLWFLPRAIDAKLGLRSGSKITGIAGIVDHRMGRARIQLEKKLADIQLAPRPINLPAVDSKQMRIAGFNVLNYWNGDGKESGFPTERGASSKADFQRQTNKLVASISAIQPDVAALMEVENDGYGPLSSLAQLVGALNRKLGKLGDYTFVRSKSDKLGSDAIRVALIYRTSRVRLVGASESLTSEEFDTFARTPFAQSFQLIADNSLPITVIANHFKSKGGCNEADSANQDQGDGQGCWNAIRTTMARQLAQWAKSDPTHSGVEQILLVGDFNAYAKEDPTRLMLSQGFVDAIDLMQEQNRATKNPNKSTESEPPYSFVYAGNSGRLDHALVTPTLAKRVVRALEWHINADELYEFDYQTDNKHGPERRDWYQANPYRSSDHDPIVLDFK